MPFEKIISDDPWDDTEAGREYWAEQEAVDAWAAAGAPSARQMFDRLRGAPGGKLEPPLTIAQAAVREAVSTRTVRRWIASGAVDAHRVGPQWRITAASLAARRVQAARPQTRTPPANAGRARAKAKPAADPMGWPE